MIRRQILPFPASPVKLAAVVMERLHRSAYYIDQYEVQVLMRTHKTVASLMSEKGVDLHQLVEASGLDKRVVEAIVAERYTTSPTQRERIANALGARADDISWCQAVEVDPMYGHGPQFGRSP